MAKWLNHFISGKPFQKGQILIIWPLKGSNGNPDIRKCLEQPRCPTNSPLATCGGRLNAANFNVSKQLKIGLFGTKHYKREDFSNNLQIKTPE